MMQIVLFGYGKMGKLIEQFATKRGHQIALIVDHHNRQDITVAELSGMDMAIDFSTPDAVMDNIELCFEAGVPLVVGTTGWYGQLEEVRQSCLNSNNSILYGSNFSIGVNVLFHINRVLARIMVPYQGYEAQIEEIHHIHKLDAPSGTAITLAEGILEHHPSKKTWVNTLVGEGEERFPLPDELLIESHRIDEVPGTHTVLYSSEIDQLELKHTAHSRKGFALGAVLAAEWLSGRKGVYEVQDIFDF